MKQYRKIIDKLTGDSVSVNRTDCLPQLIIPIAPGNTDYQEYLEWLAEGNTPEPADTPE